MMRWIYCLPLCLLLSACGSSDQGDVSGPSAEPATKTESITLNTEPSASFDEAIAAAKAAIAVSTERGHPWSTSTQLLKAAKAAAAAGDEAAALRLADEARMQAELAIIQADTEASHWRDAVISD